MSNDPNQEIGVCPHCGATSEDFMELGDLWQCAECGEIVPDDELVTSAEFGRERKYDERADRE